MASFDTSSLLEPVSGGPPSGPDLAYDADFRVMEQAARGKPESQFAPAEEPNWKQCRESALAVLKRSRDLRAAVLLAQALGHTQGFEGFADGLQVVHGLLDQWWDDLHPKLDPAEGNDPTMRVNAIAALASRETTFQLLRELPLVEARGVGRFGLREIEWAEGKTPPAAGADVPAAGTIEAAFKAADLDAVQATVQALRRARDLAKQIGTALSARVGAANSAELEPLHRVLGDATKAVEDRLARRSGGDVVLGPLVDGPTGGGNGGPQTVGEVRTREDVVRLLDLACSYFERHEPSSPIPLLLKRAKRLTSMGFLEIMRDLAPGGVSEVQKIAGEPQE
jgi:type VI secretion system protein ImpA